MNKILVKSGFAIAVILCFLVCVYFVFLIALKKAEPAYSGTIACSNLQADAEIYFDSTAIPYISASSPEDAAYAMGYLHARERLFQMDLMRRAAEGRLSEVFGDKTLGFDEMFLTVGIKRTADKIYQAAGQQTKTMLTAYARGVNEFIHTHRNKTAVEFDMLGYEPAEWTPINSIEIIRLIAWELNISWWSDFTFTELVQKLGREKAQKLLPDYPENGPVIIPGKLASLQETDLDFLKTDRAFRSFAGFEGTHIGSNNWALHGNKTVSGKPLIANDPHLTFQAPGKWYFCSVRSNGWNADGVTLPGVPAIVIGKNQSIAWALTNVMADDADFYVDSLDQSKTNYFFDGQWRRLKSVQDTILVKGAQPIVHETFLTHRGPIISGIHPLGKLFHEASPSRQVLDMHWVGNDISDEYAGFFGINKAENWGDFKRAVAQFAVPGQNFVYADNKGNIGYLCGAKLPIRRTISPIFFYDGTHSEYDWQGYVPVGEMPELYNPPQNYVASANNKTVSSFPYYISNLWEPSSRIERIKTMIEAKDRLSAADCKAMQMDVQSPYAAEVTPYIIAAFKGLNIKDENLKKALQLLGKWDCTFDKESQAPAIYAMFYDNLLRYTLKDDLGDELYNEYVFVANVPYRVMQRLLKDNGSDLFDDLRTPQKETRDDIIRKSMVDALSRLERLFGHDVKNWQWGSLHTVSFKHVFHGNNPFIDHSVDIGPFPIGGDGTTVCNGEYNFYQYNGELKQFRTKPFENVLGPSMRIIYDFSRPDQILYIMPTGQSGVITGSHYKDMTQLWLTGGYLTIKTDALSVKQNKDKLVLTPKQ
jgi:penicillin amidase